MKALHRVALFATTATVVACSSKDSTSPTFPTSIAGTWTAFFRQDSITAAITQSGSTLGGTAVDVFPGDVPDTTLLTLSGTYTPPNVHLVFSFQGASSHLDGTISGNGNTITGQVADDQGSLGTMTLVKQ